MVVLCNSQDTSEAGIIKLVNNTRSRIEINVVSTQDSKPYCKKCLLRAVQREEKGGVNILVPSIAFAGWQSFSILDVTHGLLGAGTCRNLNVHKNYTVSFFETFLGTRCESKEIPEKAFNERTKK